MSIARLLVVTTALWLVVEAVAARSAACAGEVKEAEQADDRSRLQGEWKVTRATMNGKDVQDPGISGATFTFHDDALIIASPHEPAERYAIGLETAAQPRAMTARRVEPGGGAPGWMIYALEGSALRIARYGSLQKRPKGFGPEADLLVLDLARPVRQVGQAPEPPYQRVLAHPSGCWFALFSPDGKTLATGGNGRLIRLWDVANLNPRKTLREHISIVNSGAFSPDGKLLATGGRYGAVVVVDVEQSNVLTTLPAHKDTVRAVGFSPDGKILASCSEDRTIRLWDTANWQLLRALPEQARGVKWVGFSPDGKTLASVTGHFEPGELTLWDPSTGQARKTIHLPFFVWMCVFSPDGKTLAYAGHGPGLHYLDTGTYEPRAVLPLQPLARPMAYSADGKLLAIGFYKKGVEILDAASGRLRWKLTDVGPSLFGLAFSPDGKTLAIASQDGTFTLQDLARTPEATTPP